MKKTYVKPFASFESFELSANIAGSCVEKTNHAKYTCAYDVGGKSVFIDSMTACSTTPPKGTEDKEFWGVCYDIPNGALFTS